MSCVDSRAVPARERCSWRSAASASTVTTSPPTSVGAGAVAVLAARPLEDAATVGRCPASSSTIRSRPWAGSRPRCGATRLNCSGRGHHGLERQDEHEGPHRLRAVGRLGPTVSADGSFNTEVGLPADDPVGGRDDRVPRPRDGHARRGAHRLPRRHRRAGCRASSSTSARRTWACSARARRSPARRASWSAGSQRDGVAVLNGDDPLVRGRWPAPTAAQRRHVRRVRRQRRPSHGHPHRRAGPAIVHPDGLPQRRRPSGDSPVQRRALRLRTRSPPLPSRCRSAASVEQVADALRAAEPRQQVAHGGVRRPGRVHRGQRRLQRESRVDARRAEDPRGDGRRTSHVGGPGGDARARATRP